MPVELGGGIYFHHIFQRSFQNTLKKGKRTEKGVITTLWLLPHSNSSFMFTLCMCIGVFVHMSCNVSSFSEEPDRCSFIFSFGEERNWVGVLAGWLALTD